MAHFDPGSAAHTPASHTPAHTPPQPEPHVGAHSHFAPPPFESGPATGRMDGTPGTDGYGWQGETVGGPPPYQQYQPYQPYQPYRPSAGGYYAGPMAPATSGFAIASLICSILGVLGMLGFGSILGIIFGHMAVREIDNANGMLQGRGIAQAGMILGYISLGLALLVLVGILIAVFLGVGASLFAPQG